MGKKGKKKGKVKRSKEALKRKGLPPKAAEKIARSRHQKKARKR